MTDRARFRVIEGGNGEFAQKGKLPKKRAMWRGCGTCEAVTGTASRAVIAVILGPDIDADGRLVAGQKGRACLMCASRGQLTLFP
jgi:hypothetical protein